MRSRDGRFTFKREIERCPLVCLMRRAKSARVSRGNATRRLNEMRRARMLMVQAPDYPMNQMVEF